MSQFLEEDFEQFARCVLLTALRHALLPSVLLWMPMIDLFDQTVGIGLVKRKLSCPHEWGEDAPSYGSNGQMMPIDFLVAATSTTQPPRKYSMLLCGVREGILRCMG